MKSHKKSCEKSVAKKWNEIFTKTALKTTTRFFYSKKPFQMQFFFSMIQNNTPQNSDDNTQDYHPEPVNSEKQDS